ncbi:MAG: type II and III secretion system protein family protein [Alphaproteobacteria bacterium]|nr:type II and III secretion system protein family protein [Alphaproteobacteria bacterium]MBU1563022.1 type II and III secretion system protein family protein [Alphaproteobacteria bacterium]MBU2304217.1 type II and III secretion system protein family protein [Alphaproteobacteria bacterium]MBU2368218.1 type II and III secretion system protein family protein [Alphaproteobacteria bacterium]
MNKFLPTLRRRAAVLAAPLLLLGLFAVPAIGTATAQETHISISPAAYGATRKFEVEINKTALIDLPAGAAEVIISQPSVAAAIMRTRTRAIIQGITGGDTNIFFLDDSGRTIAVLDVQVIEEPSQVGNALQIALARIIPGSNIRVESVTLGEINRVVLTGNVLSGEDRERATQVAVQFAGGADNVANILDVSGAQQVMLQVTVSEVKRSIAKQFGINLAAAFNVGTTNLLNFTNIMKDGEIPHGANAGFSNNAANVNAAIRALEQNGALRVLAQPTLTAISGEAATFLAGGEMPYVTFDEDDTGGLVRKIEFKPYGVELAFTPVVKSNGSIGLKVETSVSEPQADMSITKREASTSVELPSGTTLSIGGLLEERTSTQIDQFPWLGDIPILGALFRSRDYRTDQTELVILVTPYLVGPSPANSIPVPTDRTTVASDAEGIFLGRLENMYGVGQTGEMRGSFSGSVGFVLD